MFRDSSIPRIELSVEADAPPVVRALARELAVRLEDPSFAEATERLEGVVSLSDASTPQAVSFRLGGDRVSLVHGRVEDADLTARAALNGAARPLEVVEGAPGEELERWLASLLDGPSPPLADAAAGFWLALERMPGAPAALLVVEDRGEELRFGAEQGRAYELRGSREALVAVLSGRTPLIDAGFAGEVIARGTFTELSVLTGAGFAIRYGNEAFGG